MGCIQGGERGGLATLEILSVPTPRGCFSFAQGCYPKTVWTASWCLQETVSREAGWLGVRCWRYTASMVIGAEVHVVFTLVCSFLLMLMRRGTKIGKRTFTFSTLVVGWGGGGVTSSFFKQFWQIFAWRPELCCHWLVCYQKLEKNTIPPLFPPFPPFLVFPSPPFTIIFTI